MGIISTTVDNAGGKVYGVIPKNLESNEGKYRNCVQKLNINVVENLSERKTVMANLSDAFIVLPGGFGNVFH